MSWLTVKPDVVAHWYRNRLLGLNSWVRIRHLPESFRDAEGSLCNNVKSQDREGKPHRRQKTHKQKKQIRV